jgi:hypothetical protein
MSTTEELLERESSGSNLENRDYRRRGSTVLMWHPSIRKMLALTSPTSGGRSVGSVRSRTQATEFVVVLCIILSENVVWVQQKMLSFAHK